jgi:hypothetical protein
VIALVSEGPLNQEIADRLHAVSHDRLIHAFGIALPPPVVVPCTHTLKGTELMTNRHARLLRAAVAAAFVLTLSLLPGGCATSGERIVLDRSVEHRWSRDIEVMFDTLPERHKNLFFRMPEREYRDRVAELNERAPGLSAEQFEVELRRILAEVGDAHTNIGFERSTLYALQFHAFEEGLYVVAAVPGCERWIGARLERVGGMPVEEFRELAAEITPHDNDSQLEMMTPHYLAMPGVLAGLGVSDSTEEVTFTLRLEDGSSETIEVPAMERDSVSRLVSIRDRLRAAGVDLPVSRRTGGKLYRFEHFADRGAVYVQYNSCREDESYPMGRFVEDVFETVGRRDVETLIVDLRRNSGGSSPVFRPFIEKAAAWVGGADTPGADTPGARDLYVLIGRDTFSSAVLNAIDLKQEAGAVFVGEPSGGRPNHYGEIKSLELPDLGRRLTYSTKYFTHYKAGDPPALMPDIEVPVSFEAYVDGRDPALEAVLEATHAGARAAERAAPNG